MKFERYPQIKDNFIIDGKVYAIYAGIPDVSVLALMVKNEFLEETGVDINAINDIDALYEFMNGMHHGNEPESNLNEIMTSMYTLLGYAIYNSNNCFLDLACTKESQYFHIKNSFLDIHSCVW